MVIMSSSAIKEQKRTVINSNIVRGFIDGLTRVKFGCLITGFCFKHKIPACNGGNNSARKLLDFSV